MSYMVEWRTRYSVPKIVCNDETGGVHHIPSGRYLLNGRSDPRLLNSHESSGAKQRNRCGQEERF